MTRHLPALLLVVVATACGSTPNDPGVDGGKLTRQVPTAGLAERPAEWAQPIDGVQGLPNFYGVTDNLYRSAQPEDVAFAELKKMGIKTVVNLRSLHSDRDQCREAGLGYEKIKMQAWNPDDEDVIDFVRIAVDEGRHPVLVHCQHGADRTGTVIAAYRIVVQGWSKEDAIEEMTQGGYGYHKTWGGLIEYLQELDVEAMRTEIEK